MLAHRTPLRVPCSLAFACALAAQNAFAQELPRARLDFVNGATTERCLDEPQLRQLVAARLGRDPFDPTAPLTVRVRLERSASTVRATVVRVEGERSSAPRMLLSRRSDCSDIGAALGLAVSMTIDPLARTPAADPAAPPTQPIEPPTITANPPPRAVVLARAPRPSIPPRAAPVVPVAPPAQPGQPPAAPWTVYASVAIATTFGALPAPSLGPQGLLALQYGALSMALSARFDSAWPSLFDASGSGSFVVYASLGSGALRVCGAPSLVRAPRVTMELCALGSLGALAANATMLDQSTPSASLYAAVGAEVATSVRFGRWWGLRIGVEGVATLVRARQTITEQGRERELWLAPPFSLAISAGPVVYFL